MDSLLYYVESQTNTESHFLECHSLAIFGKSYLHSHPPPHFACIHRRHPESML